MLLRLPPTPQLRTSHLPLPSAAADWPPRSAPRGCLRAGLSPTENLGGPQATLSKQCWVRCGMPSAWPRAWCGSGRTVSPARSAWSGTRRHSWSSCIASVAVWLPVNATGRHPLTSTGTPGPNAGLQPQGPQAAGWTVSRLGGSSGSLTSRSPLLAKSTCAQDQPQTSGPR